MTLPSEPSIQLPLLLELERGGGKVRKVEPLYSRVASHFLDITAADRRLIRESTKVNLWENIVDWTRNDLRTKGELNGGESGVWEITEVGRRRVRADLMEQFELSQTEAEEFIRSSLTIPQRVGDKWQPKPLRMRLGRREPKPSAEAPARPRGEAAQATQRELVDGQTNDARQQLHALLMKLHPQQFEAFAAKLLESLGFTDTEVTSFTGDGGIDGYGNLQMGVVKIKAAFQVKRWRHNVPRPEVDRFRGAIAGTFDQGIFITTSDFSGDAKSVSSKIGTVPIVMINGTKIVDLMLEKGLGIRHEPLTIIRVDEEFFEAFGISEE